MTEEQKKRLAKLKVKNKDYVLAKQWEKNVMLQECLSSLNNQWTIADSDMSIMCFKAIASFACRRIEPTKEIQTVNEITDIWIGQSIYIVWDEATLPVLKCDFQTVKKSIDDVLSVAFDTWILSEELDKMIHFSHNGRISIFQVR